MVNHHSASAGLRHQWPDRLFHWTMALSVLILLFSAFLPIIGIKFDWIPWHWIAGVCLSALLLFHIVRATLVQGLSEMLPSVEDLRELRSDTVGGRASVHPLLPSKYDAYQKSFHWTMAITILALTATGLPMLVKLDTVFWRRDPSLFSDIQWGYIYVVHGVAALVLIFLVILHIYFAFLPEHKRLLISMMMGRGPLHKRGGEHS